MNNKIPDLVLPGDLILPIENYSTTDLTNWMSKLQSPIINLVTEKDKNYNGSWANRGILSAQLNFERKIDRINAQFYNGTIHQRTNENITDTFIDNSVYSLFYLYLLSKKRPEIQGQVAKFIEQYTQVIQTPKSHG